MGFGASKEDKDRDAFALNKLVQVINLNMSDEEKRDLAINIRKIIAYMQQLKIAQSLSRKINRNDISFLDLNQILLIICKTNQILDEALPNAIDYYIMRYNRDPFDIDILCWAVADVVKVLFKRINLDAYVRGQYLRLLNNGGRAVQGTFLSIANSIVQDSEMDQASNHKSNTDSSDSDDNSNNASSVEVPIT
jgi:hypothetical protein